MAAVKIRSGIFLCVIFSSQLSFFAESKIAEHEILSLPGWSGHLPIKQYSGYMPLLHSSTKKFFYWFIESANDPQTDPIVMIIHGGPVCSSLEILFSGMGWLDIDIEHSTESSTRFTINPHSWNKIANLLILESPVKTGFSYSTNPEVDYNAMNDNTTGLDNYDFLISFFQAYPEYRKNDFYVHGVSYAGVYVPMLMDIISQRNKIVNAEEVINARGLMIGNGCTGNKVGSCSYQMGLKHHTEFFRRHALISEDAYSLILQECKDFQNLSDSCNDAILDATGAETMGVINTINIHQPCLYPVPSPSTPDYKEEMDLMDEARHHKRRPSFYQGLQLCGDESVYEYFNSPMVREAIHAKSIDITGNWTVCQMTQYKRNIASVLPIYPALIKAYRVLVYNGDLDGCVPAIESDEWTSNLNFSIAEDWRPWTVDDQVAGYVTKYDKDFFFLTIRGAGHQASWDKPKQHFAMFERFIKNVSF